MESNTWPCLTRTRQPFGLRKATYGERYVNQIDGAIVSNNDVRRLRQLKQFLTDKLAVLSKLDEGVLELTEDADLDAGR